VAILAVVGIAVAFAPFGVSARAQESGFELPREVASQLDSLASRVAGQIRQSKIDPADTKILVIDFSSFADKRFSRLGTLLAEQFSRSLSNYADGFSVPGRKLLTEYLRNNFIDLGDMRDEGVAIAVARFLGASGMVTGDLKQDPDRKLLVTLQFQGVGSPWAMGTTLSLTDQMEVLLKESAPSFIRDPASVPVEPDVLAAGINGVGIPECVYCPPPLLTDAARLSKYRGSITLSVVVTPAGAADAIFVLKGAPFQMNEQAMETVRKWKFKPAMKNGKPVSSRVPVEIDLRIS
jgi:TonB family protein